MGSFLARPCVWLNQVSFCSHSTPFSVIRSLLEAIAAPFRGWEPVVIVHLHCVFFLTLHLFTSSQAVILSVYSLSVAPLFVEFLCGLILSNMPSFGAMVALDLVRNPPHHMAQIIWAEQSRHCAHSNKHCVGLLISLDGWAPPLICIVVILMPNHDGKSAGVKRAT